MDLLSPGCPTLAPHDQFLDLRSPVRPARGALTLGFRVFLIRDVRGQLWVLVAGFGLLSIPAFAGVWGRITPGHSRPALGPTDQFLDILCQGCSWPTLGVYGWFSGYFQFGVFVASFGSSWLLLGSS